MANYHPGENSTSKTSNTYIYYRVKIEVTSTNSSARTAVVKATLQFKRTDTSTYTYTSSGGYGGGYTSTIGGNAGSLGNDWSFSIGSSWKDIISSSHTYNVSTDGNISYSGSATSFNGTVAPTAGTLNYPYSGTIASGLGPTATSYTVKIDPCGGSFRSSLNTTLTSDTLTYTVNSNSHIIGIFASRQGYHCVGWYTAASGGTWIVENGGNLMGISQNRTLYAHWEADPKNYIYDLWLKINDSWLHGVPWIKVNGNWCIATRASTKVNDGWKETKIN